MRIKLLIAVLSLATAADFVALVPAALAQDATPAAAGKLAAVKKSAAAPSEEVAPKGVSIAEKAQKCLKIEDKPDDHAWRFDDWTEVSLQVDGDKVVLHWTAHVTFIPTGKSNKFDVVDIFAFRNGKIVDLRQNTDTALVMTLVA